MNELTREASKQTILEAISFLWAIRVGRVRKSLRTQEKPLKHDFKRYCTEDIDVSSPCERLPPEYQNHLDRKYVKNSDGLEGWREYCRQLDADDAEIERVNKRLF